MLKDLEKKLYTPSREETEQKEKKAESADTLDLRNTEIAEPEKKTAVPEAWQTETQDAKEGLLESFFPKMAKFSKWIFWILMAGALLLIGFGGYFLYEYTRGSDMSLTLSAPASILIGVPFEAETSFTNKSDQTAEDAILSIALPENIFSSDDQNKRTITQNLGDILPGQNVITKIPLVVFGTHDTLKRLEAQVSYYPPSLGPKVRFEKSAATDIAVREPAIKIDISAPPKILNDEPFEITLTYANASQITFPHAQIDLSLPNSFKLAKAIPQPTKGTATWVIDNLDAGGKGTITITGSVLGEEGSSFEVRGAVKTQGKVIDEKSAAITITPSSLSLTLAVNNQTTYVARPGETLQYTITYKNNADIGLNDAVIQIKANGEMFDFATTNTNGSFNSINNTITWNAGQVPDLRLIQQGGEGSVSFTVRTKNVYPIRRLADKNFLLTLDAQITSPTVPYYVSADKTISLARLTTKVAGNTTIQSQVFYTDPTGQIKNKGPVPPKVNTPTTFVVLWRITTYAADAANAEIKAMLAPGVQFTNIVKSNTGSSTPQFNASLNQVIWAIPKMVANKGVVNAPVEALFQIEATPNVAQAGQVMPLLGETSLTALDTFTSSTISMTAPALTSQITNDTTANQNQWTVQP